MESQSPISVRPSYTSGGGSAGLTASTKFSGRSFVLGVGCLVRRGAGAWSRGRAGGGVVRVRRWMTGGEGAGAC